jgi:DNA-binding LacI/PurR family transcriptional regulator
LVKLTDIAKYLNVSVSTVSRVVNNKNRVDPETRRKILAALKKFNYQPDENARSLKTNTSNILGVIVPDITNPYYSAVIKGIEQIASQNGFSVILCNTDEIIEREKLAVRLLLRQKAAGLISATVMDNENVQKYYNDLACPVVFFDNVPSADLNFDSVSINNIRAAKELVGYMINRGYRRIFMITGPSGESSADDRMSGWKLALQAAGIEPEDDWSVHGDFDKESGKTIMESFLKLDVPPEAICIANNFMAYGAMKAIYDAGLSIPEDMMVGAFDIVDTTDLIKLKVMTIVEPAGDIGAIAAEMCLEAGRHKGVKMSRRMSPEYNFFDYTT